MSEEEVQFYDNIFKMVCEILNSYKDTYVNLHCCLTLSAFCKTSLHSGSQILPVLRTLMNKLTSANVGLDDSASLYLGHAITNLLVHSIDEANDIAFLLPQCITRIVKTNMPSCIKSFSLPLCYVFALRKLDLLP